MAHGGTASSQICALVNLRAPLRNNIFGGMLYYAYGSTANFLYRTYGTYMYIKRTVLQRWSKWSSKQRVIRELRSFFWGSTEREWTLVLHKWQFCCTYVHVYDLRKSAPPNSFITMIHSAQFHVWYDGYFQPNCAMDNSSALFSPWNSALKMVSLIHFVTHNAIVSELLMVAYMFQVAYVSRIMSKTFRKEGQPEKERIAKITGMDIDKVTDVSHFNIIWYVHVHICMDMYFILLCMIRFRSGSRTAVKKTDSSRTVQWGGSFLSATAVASPPPLLPLVSLMSTIERQ